MSIEFEIDGAVGPRVKVWGDVDAGEVDAACPDGWEVDWDTTPANLDSTRNGERGYAHPLRAAYGTALPAGRSYPDSDDPIAVTDADVESLRTAAGQAGDLAQVEICDRALRLVGRDVDAWEQCERVILSWRAEKRS